MMLSRSLFRGPLLAKTGVTRCFSTSQLRFNQPKPYEPPSEPRKKKPLSRVAIGGSQESKKLNESTVEFSAWKAILIFLVAGGAGTWIFQREKRRLEVQKEAEANRGYGKPLIGGPFTMIDHDRKEFTEKNLLGKFSLIYFGFTHCPDICPEELDKMAIILDELKKDSIELQPLFITCDPARDSPEVVKEYLAQFHPDVVGLTGSWEQVREVCKTYRVYFSTPPDVKPGQDYLVDHSIFFYLMDPEGQFIDVIGRNFTTEAAISKIKEQVESFVPKSEREKRENGWLGFLWK